MFLMLGGEGEAVVDWFNGTQWVLWAATFHALCIQLEHRYYGQSAHSVHTPPSVPPPPPSSLLTCTPSLWSWHSARIYSRAKHSTTPICPLISSYSFTIYQKHILEALPSPSPLKNFLITVKNINSQVLSLVSLGSRFPFIRIEIGCEFFVKFTNEQ